MVKFWPIKENLLYSYFYIILVCCCIIRQSWCLYEDQIGDFDWHAKYIGKAKFTSFDQSAHSSKRLIIGSESGAIASLSVRTGVIVWRQVMEHDGQLNALLHRNKILISVSSHGRLFRRWDLNSGNIVWESFLSMQSSTLSSSASHSCMGQIGWNSGCIEQVLVSNDQLLVTLVYDLVIIHSVGGGTITKKIQLPYSDTSRYFAVFVHGNKIYVAGAENQRHVIILSFNIDSGEQLSQQIIPSTWISSQKSSCLLNQNILICTDVMTDSIQYLNVMTDTKFSTTPVSTLSDAGNLGKNSFIRGLFDSWTQRREFVIILSPQHQILARIGSTNQPIVIKELKSEYPILLSGATLSNKGYVFAVNNQKNMRKIDWLDMETDENIPELSLTIDIDEDRGLLEHAIALMFLKKDKNVSYRLLFRNEDHSLAVLQQNGRLGWSREEALTEIVAAEIVELALPVSERLQSLYDEFSSEKDGIAALFIRRVVSQLNQLHIFLTSFKHFPYNLWSDATKGREDKMYRDQFNLHKIIVVATISGKLFGIDTASGDIVWKHYLHNLVPFNEYGVPRILLFEQRTAAHYPLPPRCIVLGNFKNDDKKSLTYIFNPLTGMPLDDASSEGTVVDYKIQQAMILSLTDNHFAKLILLLDTTKHIHISPSKPEAEGAVIDNLESLYIYTINKTDGQLNGYTISTDNDDRIVAKNIWNTLIPVDNQIISIVRAKLPNEPVHSQGRVLGNRSVLYKYANPNLIAVATESLDKEKPVIDIYLIDAVTGAMVFHTSQKSATGPIRLVLSEHWVLFHYWSMKYRRYEMSIIELYEGQKKQNETVFSSFMTRLSTVSMQSYIFPSDVITMTVTHTEKGIAHKDILIGLPSGSILSLPKALLDPRRPMIPSAQDREEGLIQYVPELPFPSVNVINYNKTISGLKKIITAPAGLESTSHVFAYGLDLFCTRVTPSKMFDVLKEDFDYAFVSIVLTAMIVVSVVTAQLASSFVLKSSWK